MGETCSKPKTDDADDLVVAGKEADSQSKAKAALRKTSAEELLVIPDAEVVIISGSGEEAPVQAGSFVLLKLQGPRELAVLFVGSSLEDQDKGFYYPVLPETPVLLSGNRFLTVHAGAGDVFGIRLPKELPGGKEQLLELVDLLSKQCSLQVQQEPDMADKVASHIAKGSEKLVSGVEMVAGYVSQGIRKGGDFARSKLAQKSDVKVSDTAKATVASARFVTGGAVVITGAVADGLLETALILGREAGKLGGNRDAGGKESSALRVGRAAGLAGMQVFDALMKAGDTLVQETCDETSAVVGHRYGKDAAEVTKDGLGMAKDVKQISDMFGKKAVKTLAAKATLYTARGMIEREADQGAAGSAAATAAKTAK